MKFLFHTTVSISGQLGYYNVNEIEPGKYQAELLDSDNTQNEFTPELIIWKENGAWKTEKAPDVFIAERIGEDIERYLSLYMSPIS